MREIWSTYGYVGYAFAAALPVVGLAAWALVTWRRRRGVPADAALRQTLAEVAIVAGTAPWLFMGFLPHPHPPATRLVHLMPFADLVDQWRFGIWFFVVQVTANLLVFAAAGFAVPIRWRVGPGAVLAGAAVASALLEIGQYLFAIGRVTSVDDVLVNAVGAWLAALCSAPWWARRRVPRAVVVPA
jgi:hypothetical protein